MIEVQCLKGKEYKEEKKMGQPLNCDTDCLSVNNSTSLALLVMAKREDGPLSIWWNSCYEMLKSDIDWRTLKENVGIAEHPDIPWNDENKHEYCRLCS